MHERRRLLVIATRIHSAAIPVTDRPAALLIEGDRIAAVGDAADLRRQTPSADVLDLSGAVLTPGLCDAHIHLTEWALARAEIDLAGTASPEEAARRIAAAAGGGWIRGRGWNPHRWQGAEPHRRLLDEAVPGAPVMLQSHDMHSLWASSRALELAGITRDTTDPPGGRIVRDQAGDATGLLLENAAQLVVDRAPSFSFEDVRSAVLDAQAELHRFGITAVHSFPGIHVPDPDPLPVLESLRADDRLRLRVLQHIRLDRLGDAVRIGLRSGFGGRWIRIGGVKMFLDGALGSRTAWMKTPYEGSSQTGIPVTDPDAFRDAVRTAAAHGIATTVHAIGDAAVQLALDVLADPALRVAALPHRIEHVQCCPAGAFDAAARAGIVCSMQPAHLITDWRAADRHWGPDRASRTYAFASLARRGTVLAFGSDAPVEPADPRLGLHAAVCRLDLNGEPADGWHPAEAISAADALKAYTAGPAHAAGMAGRIGTLEPGAFADIAAWDRDPLEPGAALLHLHCIATLVGGHIVSS